MPRASSKQDPCHLPALRTTRFSGGGFPTASGTQIVPAAFLVVAGRPALDMSALDEEMSALDKEIETATTRSLPGIRALSRIVHWETADILSTVDPGVLPTRQTPEDRLQRVSRCRAKHDPQRAAYKGIQD